jgi:hypothetical protein
VGERGWGNVTDIERHREHLGLRQVHPAAATDGDVTANDSRYRLDVIAPTVQDVVKWAGGWLFDRRMTGWDVTVMVCDGGDFRPLQILGVDPLDMTTGSWEHRPSPQYLAVAADLVHCDAPVRDCVFRALEQGLVELSLWGEPRPEGLELGVGEVRHRLSRAARVFKSHALAAAYGLPAAPVADAETFQCGTIAHPVARRRELRRQIANG